MAPAELARLHSPIGLDLGAVTPAEVAVSITAELVAARSRSARGLSLQHGTDRSHPYTVPEPYAEHPCPESAPSTPTTPEPTPHHQEMPWT